MNPLAFECLGAIPTRCVLGEGPVWDGRAGVLWQTDIQSAELLQVAWPSRKVTRFPLPERLGSLGLTRDSRRLICAFASGFAFYEPESGAIEWLHRCEPDYRGLRMNDGRIDRQGRFWCGSMVEREQQAPPERGTLYRLDPSAPTAPVTMLSGISISNSICFSPAGDLFYFTDTPEQVIRSFAMDQGSGRIADGASFARLPPGAYPDGSDVDAAGRLWNAEWGSGRVTAYNPDGTIAVHLELPVSHATCVAFGGPELDLLFVTSAKEGLSREQLIDEPEAGNTLVYRTTARGLPASLFGD